MCYRSARRGALFVRHIPPPVSDLKEYERRPDEPDDYRHRMIMNGLAFAVTVVLIVAGIWIADVMAHMRKNQDCVLIGRPAAPLWTCRRASAISRCCGQSGPAPAR